MVIPVVMYGCESWTIKKAEHRKIDVFELWRWRRLLRVPWTARRSNQSTLREISPECSLEGLMLKLKLQYFGHLMWRADSFEKTLMLGKIEGRRRRGRQRMRWLDGITDSMDMVWVNSKSWWWIGRPGVLQSMGSQSQTRLSDWTELKIGKEHEFPGTSWAGGPQRDLWATSQQSKTWPDLSESPAFWMSGRLKARPRRPDAWGLMKGHRVGQVSLVTGLRGFLKDAMWTLFSFSLTMSFFL